MKARLSDVNSQTMLASHQQDTTHSSSYRWTQDHTARAIYAINLKTKEVDKEQPRTDCLKATTRHCGKVAMRNRGLPCQHTIGMRTTTGTAHSKTPSENNRRTLPLAFPSCNERRHFGAPSKRQFRQQRLQWRI